MNQLESEYSFLAPTWKLPTVATSSIYSRGVGTTYVPPISTLNSDWTNWNGPNFGPRYVPSYVPPVTNFRRNFVNPNGNFSNQNFQNQNNSDFPTNNENDQHRPGFSSEDGLNLTISVHPSNETGRTNGNFNRSFQFSNNDSVNYSTSNNQNQNQRRRVQIVDNSRQTPSTTINDYASGKNSRNSNLTPTFSQQNRTPEPPLGPTKHGQTTNSQTGNSAFIPAATNQSISHRDHPETSRHNQNGTIHEYLYGLANPDPGSYVSAYRNHQRRLNEEKLGRKSVMSEYKTFAQNGGFGPSFGSNDQYSNIDRSHIERKRRDYSKVVKETNQHKIDEQKRARGFSRQNGNRPAQVPKSQRAREYAETIERPHNLRPVMRLRDPNSGNVIIRDNNYDFDPRFDS